MGIDEYGGPVMANQRQHLDVPSSYNRCRMPCVSGSE